MLVVDMKETFVRKIFISSLLSVLTFATAAIFSSDLNQMCLSAAADKINK